MKNDVNYKDGINSFFNALKSMGADEALTNRIESICGDIINIIDEEAQEGTHEENVNKEYRQTTASNETTRNTTIADRVKKEFEEIENDANKKILDAIVASSHTYYKPASKGGKLSKEGDTYRFDMDVLWSIWEKATPQNLKDELIKYTGFSDVKIQILDIKKNHDGVDIAQLRFFHFL